MEHCERVLNALLKTKAGTNMQIMKDIAKAEGMTVDQVVQALTPPEGDESTMMYSSDEEKTEVIPEKVKIANARKQECVDLIKQLVLSENMSLHEIIDALTVSIGAEVTSGHVGVNAGSVGILTKTKSGFQDPGVTQRDSYRSYCQCPSGDSDSPMYPQSPASSDIREYSRGSKSRKSQQPDTPQ
ncbi:uncharacterized protein LOC119675333 [Teleopsis dalmanni]|uniref:uncharacterized protein LOC119671681 n=1 Tax=Teleopsis dalmanni TaxID=139649 RepID=UPI0018CE0EB8|nr:uncharacterized protein LOC119671681 [Teleopsis dalmanni]XP_037938356.1 uncharacterized protein LOC119671681 [Teleopsis dalmanni]XP_037942455.1 uncharacterized protein LOC119675333 [Teleopsis dalmanni]